MRKRKTQLKIDMIIPCGDSEAQDVQVMGESTAIVLANEKDWPEFNLKAPFSVLGTQRKLGFVRRNGKKALYISEWRLLQAK